MNKVYNSENLSLWEKDINDAFEKTVKTDSELFMNILSIIVFNRFNPMIGKIYKIIGDLEKFTKIIEDMSDQYFKFPNSQECKDAITLALVYYYKEVKKMNWVEVQKQLPYEKDIPIHYGKTLAHITDKMRKQLNSIMNENESDNILTI